MNNPGTITPKMIASSAVNGLPSSFLKNVVKIFFIALYILIVKLPIQKPRQPHGWRGLHLNITNNYINCMPNEKRKWLHRHSHVDAT
jgi:hypothetical protein